MVRLHVWELHSTGELNNFRSLFRITQQLQVIDAARDHLAEWYLHSHYPMVLDENLFAFVPLRGSHKLGPRNFATMAG